jgi:2-oxo-4-hydroxy-4-carboxy--5-ureidoimidazoline (OHCU) decarboxylase
LKGLQNLHLKGNPILSLSPRFKNLEKVRILSFDAAVLENDIATHIEILHTMPNLGTLTLIKSTDMKQSDKDKIEKGLPNCRVSFQI